MTAGLRHRIARFRRTFGYCLLVAIAPVAIVHSASAAERQVMLDAARASVTADELRDHAGVLAGDPLEGREAGSRGGQAAASYLKEQLQQIGLKPAGATGYSQPFLGNMQNLLGVIPGSDPELAQEYILLGAHYDHVGYGSSRNSYGPYGFIHNGADDNASGVSALMEVIDALVGIDYQPRRSVLFAFWDGEEKNLLGSKHWSNNPTVPIEQLRIVLNADMVGRMREGRLEVGGTRSGLGLRKLLSARDLPESMWLDFTWDYKDNSDHWTFYQRQIPSLYFHTGLHNDYHRPSDDVDKLNVPGIRATSQYLVEVISRLADADALPSFRRAALNEHSAQQTVLELPLPLVGSRLGITGKFVAELDPPSFQLDSLLAGGAAQQANLAPGDRIVEINGAPLTNPDLLEAAVLRAEKKVELVVLSATGEQKTLEVSLPGSPVQVGLAWREDPAEPGAVFITRVTPHSPADRAGLRLHDRLYAFNDQPVEDRDRLLARIREQLGAGAEQLAFEVETRGRIRRIVVDLKLPLESTADASL